MAIIGAFIKGLCMINVVVISNNPATELSALSGQSDMSVTKVLPTTIRKYC